METIELLKLIEKETHDLDQLVRPERAVYRLIQGLPLEGGLRYRQKCLDLLNKMLKEVKAEGRLPNTERIVKVAILTMKCHEKFASEAAGPTDAQKWGILYDAGLTYVMIPFLDEMQWFRELKSRKPKPTKSESRLGTYSSEYDFADGSHLSVEGDWNYGVSDWTAS